MNPFVTPYVGHEKDARVVQQLWEDFNAGAVDLTERRDPYYQFLLNEWQRCARLGVDIAMTNGPRLDHEELHRFRESEKLLMSASVPIFDQVGGFLQGVPGIMVLTEKTATVLHISGDERVQERAAAISGIVEGSRWDETTAGTNGMGTALAKGQPVHIYASEHFCEVLHSWSCTASPVFDADGRTVLGIVDFTTIDTDFRDQALGLTVSVANSIQMRIALQREQDRHRLLMAFADATRRYPHDDLLALDYAGKAIMHTPNERCRRVVDRWVIAGAKELRESQHNKLVTGSDGFGIGSIIWLARPTGYEKVFRPASAPASTLLTAEVSRFGAFISQDPDTRRMLADLERVASTDMNVLLSGETGTGKSLLARHVHNISARRNEPFLVVNCRAVSHHQETRGVFGSDRGAAAGKGSADETGLFDACERGTLFLDEVGELPLPLQAALQRMLDNASESAEQPAGVCRIIAASHKDLKVLCGEGKFRPELLYRLKVVQKNVKPLRERPGDIDLLINMFLDSLRRKHKFLSIKIAEDAREALNAYGWPGNVREMLNALESAVLCSDGQIDFQCLPEVIQSNGSGKDVKVDWSPLAATESLSSVRVYEREIIVGMLRKYRNVSQVAKILGLSRSTIYRKFDELEIAQSEYTGSAGDERPTKPLNR